MNDSGFVWIKFPVNSRTTRLSKVWSKKFVIVEQKPVASVDEVTTAVVISVYASEKEANISQSLDSLKRNCFQLWLTPRKCVVFRCKSRSQQYAFTVCENTKQLIHFATKSESESQQWMKRIRDLLWPPSSFIELEKTLGSAFEVSIIDNEYTHHAGLLGMYGHMNISSKKACLTHPQTGHVIQEWYMNTISFKLLHQNNKMDENKIMTMIVDTKSSTGCGNIILFCENASEVIQHVHSVRLMFDICGQYGKELVKQFSIEANNDPLSSEQLYAIPRKDGKKIDVYDSPSFKFSRPMSDSVILDCGPKCHSLHSFGTSSLKSESRIFCERKERESRLFGHRNNLNIPASMLDCSISSAVICKAANDSSSDDEEVNFFVGEECFESLQEEDIYQEIDEVVEQLSVTAPPPTLPPKVKHNSVCIDSPLNTKREKFDTNIMTLPKRRSNTMEIGSQTELNDEQFSKLFEDLHSMRLEHKEFISRIKQMLTSSESKCSAIASNRAENRRWSCEYCVMKPIGGETEMSDAEYVDMMCVTRE